MISEPEATIAVAHECAPLRTAIPAALQRAEQMSLLSVAAVILVCAIWGAGFSFMKIGFGIFIANFQFRDRPAGASA